MTGPYDETFMSKLYVRINKVLSLLNQVGEGRALYNLGNVYHAKGKHIGRLGHQDPGEFPEEVKACLEKAVEYYKWDIL